MVCIANATKLEEIEVTPEMIATGAAEIDALPLLDLAEGWASKEDAALAIYRAMRRVALGVPL
jgi:hypothetical protein